MTDLPNKTGKTSFLDLMLPRIKQRESEHQEMMKRLSTIPSVGSGKMEAREYERTKLVSEHLAARGFDDLELVGEGSFAKVVSPKNNRNIVIRIISGITSSANERKEIPYMLQAIGHHDLKAGLQDNGSPNHSTIEVVKRLDMSLTRDDKYRFVEEAEKHGYYIGSLGRGSEIGWYPHQKDGQEVKALMAVDPSALNEPLSVRDRSSYTHEPNHPSLLDQNAENLRLAKADPRLAEFIAPLEAKRADLLALANTVPQIAEASGRLGSDVSRDESVPVAPPSGTVEEPNLTKDVPPPNNTGTVVSGAENLNVQEPLKQPLPHTNAALHGVEADKVKASHMGTTQASIVRNAEHNAEEAASWVKRMSGGKVAAVVGVTAIIGGLGWAALYKNRIEQNPDR